MNKPLLIALALAAFPAQADVYKCMDAKGRSIYQESPCENANLKQVGTVKKPAVASEEERARMAEMDAKRRERSAAYTESRKKIEQEDQKKAEADADRLLKERDTKASERNAAAAERKARAAEIEAMRFRR